MDWTICPRLFIWALGPGPLLVWRWGLISTYGAYKWLISPVSHRETSTHRETSLPPGNFPPTGKLPPHRETSNGIVLSSDVKINFGILYVVFLLAALGYWVPKALSCTWAQSWCHACAPKQRIWIGFVKECQFFQYSGYGGKTSSPLGNIRPHREITNPPGNFDPHRETISPPGEKRGLNKSTAWT